MNTLSRKKAQIIKKREELKKRYGLNPTLYSSGEGINSEKDYPREMRIYFSQKIIENYYPETE